MFELKKRNWIIGDANLAPPRKIGFDVKKGRAKYGKRAKRKKIKALN